VYPIYLVKERDETARKAYTLDLRFKFIWPQVIGASYLDAIKIGVNASRHIDAVLKG
jgi:hypothetical protein